MATEFNSIDEALEALGKEGVRRASDDHGSVEHYSLKEMREEMQARKGSTAAAKPHRGIRLTRLIPPGTG